MRTGRRGPQSPKATDRQYGDRHRTVVYDPNAINPYGLELAVLLAGNANGRILHVCQDSVGDRVPGVETRAFLAGSFPAAPASSSVSRLRYVAARIAGPLRACALSSRRDGTLVVVWNRDPLDSLVLALFALVRRNVVMVVHNPATLRPHAKPLMRLAEALLVACTQTLIVHSTVHFLCLSRSQRARARVIPHLPYREWSRRWVSAARVGTTSDRAGEPAFRADMLFLGAPRADKGRTEMTGVLSKEILRGSTFRFVGPGAIPQEWASAAAANGITVSASAGGGYASDAELADALRTSSVLVAPYVNATQSGTVMMALSCGIGVVAFESGALADVVDARSLVPAGHSVAFASRVQQYLSAPWRASRFDVDDLADECQSAWSEVTS